MPAAVRFHRSRATLVSIAAIVALTVAGVMALGGGPAHAANVSCGDTITADTTLHHNLVNCPNNGILIGADNVTLDLNGHTIDGDGAPTAGCDRETEFCDEGLPNLGHDGVTVMHGSVRDFAFGPEVGKARHVRLLDISSARNGFVGILLFRCVRSLVRNSAANRTKGGGDEEGMVVFDSRRIRVLHSSFRRNVGVGINSVGSTNSLIRGNLMSRNGGEGFLLEGGQGLRVRHNRLARNGGGISLGPGSHNVIKRNHVSHGNDGIRIEKGHGNLVANNVVVHTRREGIRLGIKHPLSGGSHNVVRRNLVRDSGKDGFLVGRKDRHSRLKGNIARRAGDDGFDIESRSAKLTSNRAVRNADLGIEAIHGVNDGGGNVARHNGDPRQCTNVACN